MATTLRPNWGVIATQALAAGMTGGAIIDAYLWLTTVLPAKGSIGAMYQWIASVAIGPVATTNPAYAWLGVIVHFAVSIGWAAGYAFFARSQPFVNTRWLISGLGYGLVVYVFMQILLLGAHALVFPATPLVLLNQVAAHLVFFGVPVAYVVSRLDRKT